MNKLKKYIFRSLIIWFWHLQWTQRRVSETVMNHCKDLHFLKINICENWSMSFSIYSGSNCRVQVLRNWFKNFIKFVIYFNTCYVKALIFIPDIKNGCLKEIIKNLKIPKVFVNSVKIFSKSASFFHVYKQNG